MTLETHDGLEARSGPAAVVAHGQPHRRHRGHGGSDLLSGGDVPATAASDVVNELKPDANGRWPAPFNFNGKPCLLIRQDDEVRAFNAICTHTDCTVEYVPEKGVIFCACHNGVYDVEGRNVSGPPPRPLEMYKVTLRGQPGQEDIIVSRST
jgi:Rieske Fe-S protein